MDKIFRFFRNIKDGICNLFIWTSIIWQDRDWDQYYLYKILQFKLTLMAKHQKDYAHHTCADKIAKQIQLCANLSKRLMDDTYLDNALKPHEKKWGESKLIFEPFLENNDMYKLSAIRISTEKGITPEQIIQEDKERIKVYKRSDMLQEQDLDMLFKKMRKHIHGWWD